MEPFQEWLVNNLHQFESPAVYLGTEPGTEKRDWDKAKLHVVIVGGSTYENLTGNLAAPMLTRMVLETCPDFVVERAFFPNTRRDLEIFEKKNLPIFSLESKRRLNDFDIIAFSCLPSSAMVLTEGGLISIKDLKKGDLIATPHRGRQRVALKVNRGVKRITKIKLSDGRELECTMDHLVEVIERDPRTSSLTSTGKGWTKQIYKEAGALAKGDKIRRPRLYDWTVSLSTCVVDRKRVAPVRARKYKLPVRMTPSLAWLLGYIVGDGSENQDGYQIFYVKPLEGRRIRRALKENFGYVAKPFKTSSPVVKGLSCSSLHIKAFILDALDDIMSHPRQYRQFLSGFVQADGGESGLGKPGFVVGNTDENWTKKAFLMAQACGMFATLHVYPQHGKGVKDVWKLYVDGELNLTGKNRKLRKTRNEFATVVEVTESGDQEVYDINVPAGEMFYANFIPVHNCSFNGLDLNVIKMLDLCKIPIRRWERQPTDPLIIRGGQNDSNPTPYMNLYDVLYIGEAEVNFVRLLKVAAILQGKPDWKAQFKSYVVNLTGVLVTELYNAVYIDGKFTGWTHDGNAPYPVRAARIKDMNSSFIYAHPISNYLEEMGSGELLLSKGCLAKCLFCNEGHKEKPYRELSADKVIEAVRTSMHESGAASVTLSAFCVSSYRQKREVLRRLMEEVSPEVGLTSQRIDESAADYEFMKLSAMAGNRSVSFGVEGLSERLRTLVNKHATEEQILKATENAIKAGYNKIKYFCISNLPTESEADRKEWIKLATKVRAIRDKYPAQKVQMRFNFTDLSVCPHTPFQWIKPTLGQRNLSPFIKEIQELGIRVGFGAGKGHSLDNILQLLHIGDDRLLESMIELVLEDGETYFRQVSKSAFDKLQQRLTNHGLSLDMYYRQKKKDEPLPWDIVNYGVKKEYLYKMLLDGLKGLETPKCDEQCTACGLGKDDCPRKWEREETKPAMVKMLKLIPTSQHLILKLRINQDHRYVPVGARRQLVRRSLYLNNIPTDRSVYASSDTVRANDWVGGVEYAETRMTKKIDPDKTLMANSLNNVFTIEGFMLIEAPQAKLLDELLCHSSILVTHSVKVLKLAVEKFLASTPVKGELSEEMSNVIKISKEGFFGAEPVLLDARALINDLWVATEEDGFKLHALHDGALSIYDIYGKMTNSRWSENIGQPAARVDFYYKQGGLGIESCACGYPFYINPMAEKVCPRCR